LLKIYLPNRQTFIVSLLIALNLSLLTACSTAVNKSNNFQSVIIENRTKDEIVKDLTVIVGNYGYFKFSESPTEVVYETQPDTNSIVAYINYDRYNKNYANNYYDGYRNRNLKLPHYQILFNFTSIGKGTLVESKVDYISWQHKDDQNKNNEQGVEVQKILNELKDNAQMDAANTEYNQYDSIQHLLKYNISNEISEEFEGKNYIRKVVLSTVDYNRQIKALLYVREQIKSYCTYNGGIFEDKKDNAFYSSNGIKIPNVFYNSFNRANALNAFGIKSCLSEEGVEWRLMIKPKVIKTLKSSDETIENDQEIAKFKNPELYLYIFILKNKMPTFMEEAG